MYLAHLKKSVRKNTDDVTVLVGDIDKVSVNHPLTFLVDSNAIIRSLCLQNCGNTSCFTLSFLEPEIFRHKLPLVPEIHKFCRPI